MYIGDFAEDSTLDFKFTTRDFDTGAPQTLGGTPALSVYKANGVTQSAAGITLTADFDSLTGLNHVRIDTSADAFYAIGNDYQVVITTGTVDTVSVVGEVVANFSIENRTTQPKADYPTNFASMGIEADGHVHADVKEWIGTAVTLGAGAPDVNIASTDDIDLSATQKASVNAEADTALTDYDAVVPADLPANFADLAITVTTGEVTVGTSNDKTGYGLSAQAVDDVWDEVITGAAHNVNNSAAKYLRDASSAVAGITGTAVSAGTGNDQMELENGAVTADDILNGERVQIVAGTGVGQSRLILDSVASTDIITVDRDWTTNPSTDSEYTITGADVDLRMIEGSNTAADNFQAMYDGTGYAGGTTKLDVNVASTDDIDLSATQKASVNAEVDSALDTAIPGSPTADSINERVAAIDDKLPTGTISDFDESTDNVTADTVSDKTGYSLSAGGVDAIWDEAKSGHTTQGTFGEAFNGQVVGLAQTGTLSTTQMTTDLSEATDDHYIGRTVVFITGALAGQATDVTDYDGTSKLLTFTALTEAPANGDQFILY